MARALTSHRAGSAWVMRRCSQAEMDELVRQAGFEKRRAAYRSVGHLHGQPGAQDGMMLRQQGEDRAGRGAAVAPAEARPWGLALVLLAGMGALFFSSYGLANWLASQRAEVPFFYFEWERRIPFVPWSIVPYWSIDLLYGLSFFLWRTRAELLVHARRLLAAQVISVACFIAFPLRFAFDRPAG
ncbi:class I SAM-dependent methyltransferase family protein [Cupriavidus basilensis]